MAKKSKKFKIILALLISLSIPIIIYMIFIGYVIFSLSWNNYNLDTNKWREYKNDEYAFSFKYPQGSWQISENKDSELSLELDSGDGIDAPKHIIWIKAVKSSLPLDDFSVEYFAKNRPGAEINTENFKTESGVMGKRYSMPVSGVIEKYYIFENEGIFYIFQPLGEDKYTKKIMSTLTFINY